MYVAEIIVRLGFSWTKYLQFHFKLFCVKYRYFMQLSCIFDDLLNSLKKYCRKKFLLCLFFCPTRYWARIAIFLLSLSSQRLSQITLVVWLWKYVFLSMFVTFSRSNGWTDFDDIRYGGSWYFRLTNRLLSDWIWLG